MAEDDEMLPAIESSSLFGDAHREHLLSLYTNKSRDARRRFIVAIFAVVYFCVGASTSVLAPFFPWKVSRIFNLLCFECALEVLI